MLGTKDKVRAALRAQERSQAWLARQLGMNETLLAHYLSGRRAAPHDLLTRIAKVLGIPEEMLRPTAPQAAA